MRRPFRSRCFGTCHFCIKTSPHGYRLHAIVRKLQELKLRYSVISYLSYHSFNIFILDDLPKSDISYFLSITVPSAVRRPHLHFTESPRGAAECVTDSCSRDCIRDPLSNLNKYTWREWRATFEPDDTQ